MRKGNNIMQRVDSKVLVPVILLIAAILFPVVITQKYILQVATMLLFYSAFATAWNIIGGYAGQFALGNGLYIGLGAYAAGICYAGQFCSPWIGVVIGMLVSAGLSAVISRPCFKLSGTYFSLSTVAFLFIALYIVSSFLMIGDFRLGAAQGLLLPYSGRWQDLQFSKQAWFWVALAVLTVCMLISAKIKRSKMGYYLMAIGSDQDAASTIGVNVVMYKTYAQMISAALLSLAGSFYGFNLLAVMPAKVLGYALSLEVMMYVVIGGRSTLWGPVLGACLMGFVSEFMRTRMGVEAASLGTVFYGVALIVIVRFAPGGLIGLLDKLVKTVSRKFKKKAVAKESGEEV